MFPIRDDNPTRRTPVVTIALIVVNVAVFFLVQPTSGFDVVPVEDVAEVQLPASLRFNLEHAAIPCEVTEGRPLNLGEIEQTFAQGDETACEDASGPVPFPDKGVYLAALISMFLHGGILHLGGNMLFLWTFGNNIEDHFGHARYLVFYLASGVAATAAHVYVQPDSTVPVVGASGAIAGVMGAYLLWFPNATVLTAFFFVFIFFRHITAKWLLGFWFVSQFFVNPNEGVAWMAHVGGFVFGALIGLVVRASRGVRRTMWTRDHVDEFPTRRSGPWG